MSIRILEANSLVDNDDNFHEARLLLILLEASKRGDKSVDGLTKLAKLDFLLRYPKYLQRLVSRIDEASSRRSKRKIPSEAFEDGNIESRMIRFKYGPWDHRYREWIGLLHAKGLVDTHVSGRTVRVKLTETGKEVAAKIAESEPFAILAARSKLLMQVVGTQNATRLKNLVYQLVPEISGMAWGEEIDQ